MIYRYNENTMFRLQMEIQINENTENVAFWVKFRNKTLNKTKRHLFLETEFSKALAKYREYEEMFFTSRDFPADARRFFVKTPAGMLRVQAKTDNDDAADYPGLYIDLIRTGVEPAEDLIACVEFDSDSGNIQTEIYQPFSEEPIHIHTHILETEE